MFLPDLNHFLQRSFRKIVFFLLRLHSSGKRFQLPNSLARRCHVQDLRFFHQYSANRQNAGLRFYSFPKLKGQIFQIFSNNFSTNIWQTGKTQRLNLTVFQISSIYSKYSKYSKCYPNI